MWLRVFVTLLLVIPVASVGSGAKAFWTSLLLPGAGQYLNGQSVSATRFLTVEAALWGSYLGWQHIAEIRSQNYHTYAVVHAGISRSRDKSKEFYDDLGFYDDFHQHNSFAVVEDGSNAELYPDAAEFFWEWNNEQSRLRFRALRNDAVGAERNAVLITGLILANHLTAAVHAARQATSGNKEHSAEREKRRFQVYFAAHPINPRFALIHRF